MYNDLALLIKCQFNRLSRYVVMQMITSSLVLSKQFLIDNYQFQEEEEKLRKEEEERREHEEYLKMKAMFSVEEEGESEQTGDLDVSSLL